LAAFAVFGVRPSAPGQATAATVVVGEYDIVRLPVPAAPVPAGTRVKQIQFRYVPFPKHQVPTGALTSVEPVLEGVSIAALPANLPLFRENFSLVSGSQNPVIEQIPQGMRAMTVRVDATAAVEGWAGSGAIVDVLLLEKDRTTVVAEKVKILSAERSVAPVDGAAAPSVPSTVTLLVTQEQCLAINTATPRGKLAFALRSLQDEDSWSDTVYTAERLKGGRSTRDTRATISGYVSVDGEAKREAFALADGKWVKTQVVPEGFFPAGER
jgi:Flp pilus assembly protein CpaB